MRLRGGHCQVPCGIFDDPAMVGLRAHSCAFCMQHHDSFSHSIPQVAELKQHAATIRKAMAQCKDLHAAAGSDILAMNQMVRWIQTKEDHCAKIITTVSEYCLCQRVKKDVFKSDQDYVDALKAHHAVMQSAMKAKQTMVRCFIEILSYVWLCY